MEDTTLTKPVTRKYIWLRKAFKQLKEDFGSHCKLSESVFYYNQCEGKREFAHLHPTGLNGRSRGSYERYKDIITNKDCYILLCKKHHQMFDNGELKI